MIGNDLKFTTAEDYMNDIKNAKFDKLKDEIEEFIAAHELNNPHYLRDESIIKYFDCVKEKHVRKALKELR